jgi:hypothetical protein
MQSCGVAQELALGLFSMNLSAVFLVCRVAPHLSKFIMNALTAINSVEKPGLVLHTLQQRSAKHGQREKVKEGQDRDKEH